MRTPVEHVMTRRPVTLAPTTTIGEALETMILTRCAHVPVVYGALLVGIIARGDVVRALRATTAGGTVRPGAVPAAAST